jgi:hypothetical protein
MLKDQIADDLKDAMRAKDDVRRRTLRSLTAALTNAEIASRGDGDGELSEQEELRILQKAAKQREESIEQYEEAGRDELAEKERAELAIIKEYLPQPLTEEELRDIIQSIVDDVGAESMADMGRVMGPAMSQLRGRADGNRVREIVEEILR